MRPVRSASVAGLPRSGSTIEGGVPHRECRGIVVNLTKAREPSRSVLLRRLPGGGCGRCRSRMVVGRLRRDGALLRVRGSRLLQITGKGWRGGKGKQHGGCQEFGSSCNLLRKRGSARLEHRPTPDLAQEGMPGKSRRSLVRCGSEHPRQRHHGPGRIHCHIVLYRWLRRHLTLSQMACGPVPDSATESLNSSHQAAVSSAVTWNFATKPIF